MVIFSYPKLEYKFQLFVVFRPYVKKRRKKNDIKRKNNID